MVPAELLHIELPSPSCGMRLICADYEINKTVNFLCQLLNLEKNVKMGRKGQLYLRLACPAGCSFETWRGFFSLHSNVDRAAQSALQTASSMLNEETSCSPLHNTPPQACHAPTPAPPCLPHHSWQSLQS